MRGVGRIVAVAVAWALMAGSASAAVHVRSVSFTARDVNRTLVPCRGDGALHTIRGQLVLPDGPVPSSVTLYLHGLGYGGWFWHFTSVGGYDYATAQAAAGHASLIIDRLGYGDSDRPDGNSSCVGAQATIAHQVVQALRGGSYAAHDGRAPAFARVALAGHSLGGLIAQDEAATFHDVDALAVLAYSDLLPSTNALSTFGATATTCLTGGQSSSGAPHYAPFGQTAQQFEALMFADADPAVVAEATAMRSLDPCGDTSSVPLALAIDPLILPTIKVPVLLALADRDALFAPPLANLGRLGFIGTRDLTRTTFAGTGHAITLGRSAPAVRATIGRWLTAHGF